MPYAWYTVHVQPLTVQHHGLPSYTAFLQQPAAAHLLRSTYHLLYALQGARIMWTMLGCRQT